VNEMITLAVVDDHNLFRVGLCELFNKEDEFEVILEAANGEIFIEKLRHLPVLPEVILLDLKMPKLNGLDCLKILNIEFPEHKTLVLSMYDESPFIMKSLKSGAKGYLLKDTDTDDLFHAIRTLRQHGVYVNQSLATTLIQNIQKAEKSSIFSQSEPLSLSTLELELLSHICLGLTNAEISKIMHRSARTVEGYRQKLLDKTNTKNTAALVAWAFRKGIVE